MTAGRVDVTVEKVVISRIDDVRIGYFTASFQEKKLARLRQ